jgi:hypothetical protein
MRPDPLGKLSKALDLPATVHITDVHRDTNGVWWLATTPYKAVSLGTDRQVRHPGALTESLAYVGRLPMPRLSHGAARRALALLRQLETADAMVRPSM